MELGLMGRERQRAEVGEALDAAARGDRFVVELVGPAGSGRRQLLDEIAAEAESAGLAVVRAAGSRGTESEPGRVAELLGLADEAPSEPRVVLVDDAQWVDPTSVGLLQRAVAAGEAGQLLVVGREPLSGHRALPLQGLADTARRRGGFAELTLDPLAASDLGRILPGSDEAAERVISLTGGLYDDVEALLSDWVSQGVLAQQDGTLSPTADLPEKWVGGGGVVAELDGLERQDRKLVDAIYLAGRPLAPEILAEVAGADVDDVLEAGEQLTGAGLIAQSRDGFEPPDALTADRVVAFLGDVRRSQTLRDLAGAFSRRGWEGRDPGLVGSYYLEAGSWSEALPLLAEAALAAVDRGALGEAFPLLDGALQAFEESEADDGVLEGKLRLGRARYFLFAGWSDLAAADLEVAIRRLEGEERVQALGFYAAVEDDRQDLQASERLVAAAEYEAVVLGDTARLGSLLVLHARELSRLGFANETDAALSKGKAILDEEGNPYQRYLRRYNTARIAFDRGRAREAEVGFAGLVAEAEEHESLAGLAAQHAWWARALFMVGRPRDALESVEASLGNSDASGTSGSVFLSHMARSEGAHRFGAFEEALGAADAMLGLVLQQLPAWENAARYLRGKALLGLGRLEDASDEADRAYELCPEGINGWRWRLKIRVLQLQILARHEDEEWAQTEAEDLTDELLQGNWLDTAVDLMVLRAGRENDAELARQAAALALEVGIPTGAAEALEAGGLWADPAAAAVAAAVRGVQPHIPPEWADDWSARPEIASGLAAEEVTEEAVDEATAELRQDLESALVAAGLADPATTLSPAQRRARGLVRRRPRVRRALARLATAAAVVVLGAVGTFLVLNLTGVLEEQPDTTVIITRTLPPTETVPPGAAEVQCAEVSQITVGDQSGISNAGCVHWTFSVGNSIVSSPVIHGVSLIFGARDHNAYGIDLSNGLPFWSFPTDDVVDATPALAEVGLGEGQNPVMAFIASHDGCVYRREATTSTASPRCLLPTFRQIIGSAVIENRSVFFSSKDGHVYSTEVEQGGKLWQYPAEDASAVEIESAPAVFDGMVYVGIDGDLHAVDTATGEGRVCLRVGSRIDATPLIVDGIVYVGTVDGIVWPVRAGSCSALEQAYFIGTPVVASPAIDGTTIYVPTTNKIVALELATNELAWSQAFIAGGTISAAPAVINDILYFGSDDTNVYGVSAADGTELWRFETDGLVRSTPAVAQGAVFVGTTAGTLYAIGDL